MGVELCCRPYSAGVLHSVSDQIQNLQIDSPPKVKMTSIGDIKGLVSSKFPRPCFMEIVATKGVRETLLFFTIIIEYNSIELNRLE